MKLKNIVSTIHNVLLINLCLAFIGYIIIYKCDLSLLSDMFYDLVESGMMTEDVCNISVIPLFLIDVVLIAFYLYIICIYQLFHYTTSYILVLFVSIVITILTRNNLRSIGIKVGLVLIYSVLHFTLIGMCG